MPPKTNTWQSFLNALYGNQQYYNPEQMGLFYKNAQNGLGTLNRDWKGNLIFTNNKKQVPSLDNGANRQAVDDALNYNNNADNFKPINLGGGMTNMQVGMGLADLGMNVWGLIEGRNQFKKQLALQREALELQKTNSQRDFESARTGYNNDIKNREFSRYLNMGGSQGSRGGIADLVGTNGTAGGSALGQAIEDNRSRTV
jgi:hypothetical protein